MSETTILLAVDEATLRENLTEVLREKGFRVIACRDGAEALAAMNRQPIDALIAERRWSGDVRESGNMIERTSIVAEGRSIDADDLSLASTLEQDTVSTNGDLRSAVRAFERDHIRRVLREAGQNKVDAARRLGIGLSSLYRKLDELDITRRATTEAGTL